MRKSTAAQSTYPSQLREVYLGCHHHLPGSPAQTFLGLWLPAIPRGSCLRGIEEAGPEGLGVGGGD